MRKAIKMPLALKAGKVACPQASSRSIHGGLRKRPSQLASEAPIVMLPCIWLLFDALVIVGLRWLTVWAVGVKAVHGVHTRRQQVEPTLLKQVSLAEKIMILRHGEKHFFVCWRPILRFRLGHQGCGIRSCGDTAAIAGGQCGDGSHFAVYTP